MKPERTLVAERALAQHCPELLREGPRPRELLPRLAALGERITVPLAQGLARISGGEAPAVKCAEPRECNAGDLANEIAPLAANSLLGAGDGSVLLSIEAGAVLRMIDRAFGGRGAMPAKLPEAFPLSAELLIARLESLAGEAIAAALGETMVFPALRRDGSFGKLAPFPEGAELAAVTIAVTESDGTGWQVLLAFPLEALPILFGHGEQSPGEHLIQRELRDPLAGPFADLPLDLRAVLVDMAIPVSALSALEPGSVLPVAVARSVPLTVGGTTVAHGTVGSQDDCLAIQITHAFR